MTASAAPTLAPAAVPPTAATTAPQLSGPMRFWVLAFTFAGLVFAGLQLGLMALASLSVSRDMLGAAYNDAVAGDWFARYTAAIMLGAAIGGIALGSLGDLIGRTRAMALSILCYSLCGGAGALV